MQLLCVDRGDRSRAHTIRFGTSGYCCNGGEHLNFFLKPCIEF